MSRLLARNEVVGLIRPGIDAHTLGISAIEQLLGACGYPVVIAGAEICTAANFPTRNEALDVILDWIEKKRITRLGFSYRLDPQDGVANFGLLFHQLKSRNLLVEQGGPIRQVYFAGLPEACMKIQAEYKGHVVVFYGDETPSETLEKFGVPSELIPRSLHHEVAYDSMRLAFGRELLASEAPERVKANDRSGYPEFASAKDTLILRLAHGRRHGLPPLMRAHVGPYLPNRMEALHQYQEWITELAQAGLLDILSIGTSQLSQSNFGEDWRDRANGGGVPINSPDEFRAVWNAARPMLVRTYAGTSRIPEMARMYEETLNMAWHALSFWWFCQLDGRGPLDLATNLREHAETLRFIATTGKPFEPNIPHHFSFRGGDDVTYVVSSVLAARTAKSLGIRHLVLQIMLNTPKSTWGVQDLAKARALLTLTRELEDERFQIILQPRAGLDYFSHDLDKAKVQLAAVTALMDDIEPHDPLSPAIIHVVGYSEASHLADPAVVNESIRITRAALEAYRRLRDSGEVEDMSRHTEVAARTESLLADARTLLTEIESSIPNPYSPDGLYRIFEAGFLPVPHLWEGRDQFPHAIQWATKVINGSVKVVDSSGIPIPTAIRAAAAAETARQIAARSLTPAWKV